MVRSWETVGVKCAEWTVGILQLHVRYLCGSRAAGLLRGSFVSRPPTLDLALVFETLLIMKKTKASIYDFPVYYDLVFGSDTAAEMRFLQACFDKYVDRKVKRIFEPACGTGRLLFRMGRKGFEVGGIDLNPKAIEFCNARLERMDLKGRAQVGDMSDFTVKRPYDAAFKYDQ